MEVSIQELLITQRDIERTAKLATVNQMLALYYEKMAFHYEGIFPNEKCEKSRYTNKKDLVKDCNSKWIFDVYTRAKVRDKKGSMSCKDKFCPNCQIRIQASRLKRFEPEINKIAEEYDIYHLTLTIPNIEIRSRGREAPRSEEMARKILHAMMKNFQKFTRYLSGNAKIRGIDLSPYGYAGALRNMEFVINGLTMHPHFHALVALRKGLEFKQHILIPYSYKRDGSVYPFSDFEILIQKIWRLLMDGQKVNAKNLAKLEIGYSCKLVKKDAGDYAQIFKYVTKPEKGGLYDFAIFALLERFLHKRRLMQGSGKFHNIQPDDSIDESADSVYKDFIEAVKKLNGGLPYQSAETLQQIYFNMLTENFIYIDRSNISRLVRELQEEGVLSISLDYAPEQPKYKIIEPTKELPPQQLRILDLIKSLEADKDNK